MRKQIILTLFLAAAVCADTLELRDGRTIQGTYLGGTARQVRMEVRDRVETFDISNVRVLRFDQDTSTAPATGSAQPALAPVVSTPSTTPATTAGSTASTAPARAGLPSDAAPAELAAGTAIVIRMIDGVDSETAQVGQRFLASVDEAIVVNGTTVVPRGADAKVKLVDDKEAGKLSGRTELTLVLDSVMINGNEVRVATEEIVQQSQSRTKQTGAVVGGIAALGAIIGGIAGGGKGAAIGAVSGAATGTGVQVLTKGPKVKIPSETRLSFVLQAPMKL